MSSADFSLRRFIRVSVSREGNRAGYPNTPSWLVPAIAFIAIWAEIGIYVDGWYHWHYTVDTFFSGPHAIIYSAGFTVVTIFGITSLKNMLDGFPLWRSVPDGYQLSLVGCALFPLGGAGDFAWHAVFGFERILPTWSMSHMLIFLSGGLIMSGPLRAAWRSRARDLSWFVTIPTAMVVCQIGFSFIYTNPFVDVWATGNRPLGAVYVQELGLLSILIQAAVLTGFVLLLAGRFRLPFGALTFTVGAYVALVYLLNFHVWTIPVAIVAGLVADELMWVLKPSKSRPFHFRVFAAAFPTVIYLFYFLYLKLTSGVWWEPWVWTGTIVGVAFVGFFLSYLVIPPRSGLDLAPPVDASSDANAEPHQTERRSLPKPAVGASTRS